MNLRIIGLVLIVVGILAFSYQGYVTFQTREKVVDAGPIEITRDETHAVPVAPILGSLALIGGVVVLIQGAMKRA